MPVNNNGGERKPKLGECGTMMQRMPLLGRIAQELDLVQECQVPMPTLCAVLGWSCPKSGGPWRTAVGAASS